ncbi:DUF4855 domain-containing protein [Lederbergia panacisoli]|uniref:DUF4855 domain-containing protein n=1 Tax=Lederbergia panacisoli TaxID=1255251 RepID=UPI00214BEB1C|nr:DUF4855 domain-containing protein [Lederbergia panacisoli]MCR2822855.1 DUF4855 domain-containing protein [Lederbergia panacisoli]
MPIKNYMTAEELGVQNHICLLPCGDQSESGISKWSVIDLKPYQYYLFNNLAFDTMFKGLIFHPIIGRINRFLHPMYANIGLLAEKEDWELALNRLFYKKYNFDAAAINTEKGEKTDIWVTLPYPTPNQTNFGKMKGRSINFKIESNRIEAVKWWILEFLEKWRKAEHLHEKLSFRGFVWPRVSIDSRDEELVKNINNFIHKENFLALWLQQYGSAGCVEWKKFGFDAACTHPNYYGDKVLNISWITNSTIFAKYYHTGMQIIFGKGVLFKENHLIDYLNSGIYKKYMNDSLLVYQFPNQTLQEIYDNHPRDYDYLYSFIKKSYKPIYPTAAFPANRNSTIVW